MKLGVSGFGPIRAGFGDYIDFSKVTVFCGPQGSGKSTLTKLYSTLSWVEKILFRSDHPIVEPSYTMDMLRRDLAWQGLSDYLTPATRLDYIGSFYRISVDEGNLAVSTISPTSDYVMPKIMYIPAERNFASIIRNALRVENLPEPLTNLQVEFERAKKAYKAGYKLPANGFKFSFDEEKSESWILNGGEKTPKTPLHLASSGLQSIVPLLLVSENLVSSLSKTGQIDIDAFFADCTPEKRLNAESYFSRVKAMKLVRELEAEAIVRYLTPCTRLLNIVEEPEQNLYPATQCEVVDRLLGIANKNPGNSLVLSTHSPYVVNHLQLVAQAESVVRKVGAGEDIVAKLPLPLDSLVPASDIRLYEMHLDGTITLSRSDDGFISDENSLNRTLSEFNERYASLFEIEDAHA